MIDVSASVRQGVRDWLDSQDNLVARSDAEALAELARTRLPHVVEAWRRLLAEHEPDEDGHCRTCARRRRDRAAQCAVWTSAYRLLIKADVTGLTKPAGSSVGRHAAGEGVAAWSMPTINSPR
jgi:hypothetical protein